MVTSSTELNLWFEEPHDGNVGQKYRILETVFCGMSPFQRIEILQTAAHGKMLVLDGLVMISERDEFIYHDMAAHVPLFTHPNPKRVLVIGGGDGGTVREVLRHEQVEQCVLVEIDGMVVDVCKRFIPQTAGALDDPRVEVRIEDGVQFVASAAKYGAEFPFDVILVDSTDPIGPATPLFNTAFYRDVSQILSADGIVVSQAESPFYESQWQKTLMKILNGVFPRVALYNYSNLTYPGGLWSFSLASKGPCPIRDFDPQRVIDSGLTFRYYTPDVHRAAFALPRFQQEQLDGLFDQPQRPTTADR